ncbi:MAG TPA: carboxypeptidase M32, partial [Longimicrobiaceae bacterium]|nr:carboxypeptidase M32 [Longimicrobiaceae bacterium]
MQHESKTPYEKLTLALREAATLDSVVGLLSWDQETLMPPRGGALRAEQIASVSTLVHERRTDPQLGDWIAQSEDDPTLRDDPTRAANLREIRRQYDRATLLPGSLVRELAETTSLAVQVWREARAASDFGAFAPWLERILRLSRSKAACYGTPAGGELYDALLEEYEPEMRVAEIERIFAGLRARLTPLVAELLDSGRRPNDAPNRLRVPVEQQQELNRRVAERIGFDFRGGRLDVSAHPFCQGLGPGDTRLTTRYQEDSFADSLSSTLHEAGHGLYEQGLPKEDAFGQPLAESASFGIHESQSRLWENMVGRSRPFWEWALLEANQVFGGLLEGYDADALYRAVNRVEPSLIRVDADEATYNLHIMLRFDLERAMLRGDLSVAELPAAWHARVLEDLGLEVPDDRRGALQDIHWAIGGIGYFPTYTLGNLYAAQLWSALRGDLPDLDERMRGGDFSALLGWLRANVHAKGHRYP